MIVVLGSINADVTLRVPRLPASGETLRASAMSTNPGGKGANQAVAAARMGASVALVGRVGDDGPGRTVRRALEDAGVDVSAVHIDPDEPTGTAMITVADDGRNTIVTVGGANHRVGARELDAVRAVIGEASMLLVQLEIPMAVVVAATEMASAGGVPVMLDPAPVTEIPEGLLARIAWITPNEHEAAELTGAADPTAAVRALHQRGVTHAVVTLGERGCVYAGEAGELTVGAPRVDAIDTVACGDAFNGALAWAFETGADVAGALQVGCSAGAAAATKPGAYPSLPFAAELPKGASAI